MAARHVEDVEMTGHIIDSLLLPKVLDEILMHGGTYAIKDIRVIQTETGGGLAGASLDRTTRSRHPCGESPS